MLFSKEDLRRLIIPLILEQLLAITIGMAGTVMVASVGEAAVSGVSLVDSINVLLINVFSSLAAGGAVVASQYLGHGDRLLAGKASKVLIHACILAGTGLMVFCLGFKDMLLQGIFGAIDADVMQNAKTYFLLSALSYPFLALYNANAAVLRVQGNTKSTLYVSAIINVVNVAGNAIFIYGYHMDVFGAALSMLISRIMGAALTTVTVSHSDNLIPLPRLYKWEWDGAMLRRILRIGLPTGFEGSFFQLGKLILQSLTSSFGTAAIAANAAAGTLASIQCITGNAMSLSMVTVIGRCVGADEREQAKNYCKKLMLFTYATIWAINIPMAFFLKPLVGFFDFSQEASQIAYTLILTHSINVILTWPISFVLPHALRAAGDVKYTMTISIVSMTIFRVMLSFILASGLGLGVLGVWIAMVVDWAFRGTMFVWRFFSGRWLKHRLI